MTRMNTTRPTISPEVLSLPFVRRAVVIAVASAWLPLASIRADDLVISEFLASNRGGLEDEDGESSDWIEIQNLTASAQDLAGWSLTDDPDDLDKWSFPARLVEPAGYLVVFASGKDRAPPEGELHTSFKLAADGEFLALVRPDGTVAHQYAPAYPPQRANLSYGLGAEVTRGRGPDADIRWLVPADDASGTAWTRLDFDDSDWSTGADDGTPARTPVGFDSEEGAGEQFNFFSAILRREPGLVAYWRLGDLDGETAGDDTGRHPGTYTGDILLGVPGAIVGDADPATDLAGGSITVADSPALASGGGPWTVEAWVQPDQEGSFQWIVARGDSSSRADYLLGITSDNRFRFITQGLANVVTAPTPSTFDGRLWYHVAGVQDPDSETIRLYVNGEEVDQTSLTFKEIPPAAEFRIGDRSFGSSQSLDGRVDEIALYRRALSETEILEHYQTALDPRGFKRWLGTDVERSMRGVNASLYLRVPIELDDLGTIDRLSLRMRYEDGFIAYLNGNEIARRNAPAAADGMSSAPGDRPRSEVLVDEVFDLTDRVELLVEGLNILAVHGLNDRADSFDFLIDPVLEVTRIRSLMYFTESTPGRANPSGVLGFVADTKFSRDRGFYDEPFEVEISSATADAVILYTTDGSRPTQGAGTVYTGPILIDGTTILRAQAVKPDHAPSDVDTQTYLFLDQVLRQDGAGFPTTWRGARADYAMDPLVVDDPRYRDTLVDDLKSIPTVSVVMSMDDLFGPAGVYSNPTERGRAWERPCSVEFVDPQRDREFQVDAGLRAHGGSSRRPDITPQHSLRLHFRSEYGAARLEFPLFEESEVETFDTLVLNANSSDNWTSANTATGAAAQFIRDQWARDVHRAMGHVGVPGLYVHLYLNGLYWGLYNVVEHVDERFAAEHLGGDEEEYDVVIDETPFAGNRTAWNELLTHARRGDYEGALELMDADNFIDYMVVNMFTGNWDWPDHNWHVIRRRAAGEKFHFVVWDAEVGLGLAVNVPGPIRPGVLTVDLTGPRADVSAAALANGPGEIYDRLGRDPEFRIRFADRLQKHLFSGGVLTPARAVALYEARANEIEAALAGEAARWGDVRRRPPDVPDGRWLEERNWIVGTFLPRRPEIVLQQFRRRGLYPSVEAPEFNQHGGLIVPGFTLRMTAPSGTIYYTLDGEDPRLPGGATAPRARDWTAVEAVGVILEGPTRVRARTWLDGGWSALSDASFALDPMPPPGGLQRAGDLSQDSALDITDAVMLLGHLFGGEAGALPCDGDTITTGGNQTLADVNGDGTVNITDGVGLLGYLFAGGPPPALGTDCVRVEGCPNACGQ